VLTPGAVFERVTADQVCVAGYSSGVRDVSSGERSQVYAEYGIVDMPGADEVDHYIPLELGGSNDIANLWPEPYATPGAHEKDRVENYLHSQVCSGALALGDAQQMIVGDWYAVYLSLPESAAVPATTSVVPQDTPIPIVSTDALAPATSAQGVTFTNVSGGPAGGRASVTVQTAPGATCSVQYVTAAGTRSTAQGQGSRASKTTGQDGSASWSWAIGPSTKPGIGSVTATCSSGTASTSIPIS
jgi:hypothetical protein